MDKVWLSKLSVVAAFIIVILCTIFVLDSYNKGVEVPERVWGLLGGGLMLLFGIQLPTPGQKA